MGRIWMPGGGGGADLDVVTAMAGDVLSGKTIVDKEGEPIAGTMPNRGDVSSSLNAGGSYVIPQGYHTGKGKVTANSLASQTEGNLAANKIMSGYKGWSNGALVTGTLTISSVVNFKIAQYGHLQMSLTWARPSKGPWSGVRIVGKQGGYPGNPDDGTVKIDTADISYRTSALASGTWYFRLYNYITTNSGRLYGSYVQASMNNSAVNGSKTFSAGAGTWTVPANVRQIRYILVGHGGAGGGEDSYFEEGGSAGGGGGYFVTGYMDVTPGQQIAWNIPSKGNTTFGNLVAKAGNDAYATSTHPRANGNHAGDGGSGGGGIGRAGGSNGGNGTGNLYGKGQGGTTKGFNGVLYSGGGSGGNSASDNGNGDVGVAGAAGGGGYGGRYGKGGGNGTNGLGGGGGGNGYRSGYGGLIGGTGAIYIAWGANMK